MDAIAVPINDAREAQWASRKVVEIYRREPVLVHLINVQPPLSRHISQFLSQRDIRSFHHDEGMQVLAPAIRVLDEAKVPHTDHVLVGSKVDCVVRFAKEHSCQVILDNPADGFLSVFGLGSVASQIRRAIAGSAVKIRTS
jgi:hypothetical protein